VQPLDGKSPNHTCGPHGYSTNLPFPAIMFVLAGKVAPPSDAPPQPSACRNPPRWDAERLPAGRASVARTCFRPAAPPLATKNRGPTKQVRATLAFRQRHFVASKSGRFILTSILRDDIMIRFYCRVLSCLRASLPPFRSRVHSTYEVSRGKFRRQDPRGGRQPVDGRQPAVH